MKVTSGMIDREIRFKGKLITAKKDELVQKCTGSSFLRFAAWKDLSSRFLNAGSVKAHLARIATSGGTAVEHGVCEQNLGLDLGRSRRVVLRDSAGGAGR